LVAVGLLYLTERAVKAEVSEEALT
jgi:hypothetical protein